LIVLRYGRSYFFADCSLFVDGRYVGSGCGSGEIEGRVLECYGNGVVLRLGEDGYVIYESGTVEVGLLRDCGADEVRQFEDGVLYVHRKNACGWGVFEGAVPVVYDSLDQPAVMATIGSTILMLAVSIHGTA
jgi:hypothetical protein